MDALESDVLGKRRLGCGAIFEHYRNAILNRIVAATTIAMQPCVQGAAGTRRERVMAYGANQEFEQSLGKHRGAASQEFRPVVAGGFAPHQQARPFTMSAAARMVHD